MTFRHPLTRRDAVLLILGALFMHLCTFLLPHAAPLADIALSTDAEPLVQSPQPRRHFTKTTTIVQLTTTTMTVTAPQPSTSSTAPSPVDLASNLPATSLVDHAPGWTLFRNLYMANGSLLILSDTPSDFPQIRMMTSTGLPAENDPENIASREPTPNEMDIISAAEARRRWATGDEQGRRHRVSTVEGNTVLVNEPRQFLRHYYHLVAELFFGIQAFWHGAFSAPSSDPAQEYMLGSPPDLPPLRRLIFMHANADGWRDDPGFNGYFMRAAFPVLTIEVQEDWQDRVVSTSTGDRAWHFPLVLLVDRSASHRGPICGGQTQRIAAEAIESMRVSGRLMGVRVGGWWEPVRRAVLQFARAAVYAPEIANAQVALAEGGAESSLQLAMPPKIVVTYVSRQSATHRKLIAEDHQALVLALQELVARKGSSWELHVIEAEKLSKDEQLRIFARTTFLVGVHGNGLTSLVFMPHTRISTVIELFYPAGFAQDYQYTTHALGMTHFAIWNDTSRTLPNKPPTNYPDGFQDDSIPVYAPTVIQLIEESRRGKTLASSSCGCLFRASLFDLGQKSTAD
ncbi:hypothetical protein C8J57DRAFT_1459857 [Mycena rebaudengoi]|nr:hypothetical protein C8J57DRAFT_1459857 [Mycena rebaudengoi]